ncbi:MAG: tRNA (adenosine(37)-N6)-threonylcarbamoyltransferase complex ATPase subunit type 1 TsaE [Verrucomicrobia bacterium]|nr:tRNA (adenosine(37)-N6)-threonylcarbamoyltransferase complex ATPase subunit type 1 TsaE [Verrucomicrobiota bacterium]
MVTLISHSPEETISLGEAWGRAAQRGLVIGLSGELGAGKTQLVKGVARGLGVSARVTSPSFALVNEYPSGRLPLFHLDLYRLDTPAQIISAGLEDYLFDPRGVAVVEWMERWTAEDENQKAEVGGQRRPARYGRVIIETISELARRITYDDFGA